MPLSCLTEDIIRSMYAALQKTLIGASIVPYRDIIRSMYAALQNTLIGASIVPYRDIIRIMYTALQRHYYKHVYSLTETLL